jgi:hypothetical protein
MLAAAKLITTVGQAAERRAEGEPHGRTKRFGPEAWPCWLPMNSDVLSALIGATVAGVFGTAAVLYTGHQSSTDADRQLRIQRQNLQQQRTEALAVAVGGARLLQVEYNRRFDDIDSTLARVRVKHPDPGWFPQARVSFASAVSPDDRRKVAAALTPAAWAEVAAADVRLDRAQRLFARRQGKPVEAADRQALCDYSSRFARAVGALGSVSGDRQKLRIARRCG